MTLTRQFANSIREVEDDLIRRVDELALRENRTRSNMLRVLLTEALAARENQEDRKKTA